MNRLSVPYKKRVYYYTFPSEFDEMSPRQLKDLVPYIPIMRAAWDSYAQSHSKQRLDADIHLQRIRILALNRLIGLRWYHLRRLRALYSIPASEAADVLHSINFLFFEPNRKAPPFTSVKVAGHTLRGPADGMSGLTGEEFHFASQALYHYQKSIKDEKTPDIDQLNMLCAIIYRQKGTGPRHDPHSNQYTGDQRQPFNRFAVDHQARKWRKAPPWLKNIISWWFGSAYAQLQKAHPGIFSKDNEDTSAQSGWMPVFRALAKNPVNFDTVAKMRLNMIIYEIEQARAEAREMKRKMKLKS